MMIIFCSKRTGDLNSYILHKNTTIDGQIITTGELVVKAQYISLMKLDTT